MLIFLCIFTAILFICCLFLSATVVYLDDKIKELKAMQGDHNVMICKLMYHVSKGIEDYETTHKINDKLGKIVNLYKLSE